MRRAVLVPVVVYAVLLSFLNFAQASYAQTSKRVDTIPVSKIHEGMRGVAYTAAVAAIERRCDALLAPPVQGAEASRLWVRFRDHRDHLFVFLYDAAVPRTKSVNCEPLPHATPLNNFDHEPSSRKLFVMMPL